MYVKEIRVLQVQLEAEFCTKFRFRLVTLVAEPCAKTVQLLDGRNGEPNARHIFLRIFAKISM